MSNKPDRATHSAIALSYRTLYGKLFASLFSRFGSAQVTVIEDAIQNAFYKSLKSWKPDRIPENQENWLFVVARNDVLNQIKRKNLSQASLQQMADHTALPEDTEDQRLQLMLLLVQNNALSASGITLFVLKHIFGLHVKEISACTLMEQDAIYKSIRRTSTALLPTWRKSALTDPKKVLRAEEVQRVNEILYAVFNIGFDSFNHRCDLLVDEDLCLESLALAKVFNEKHRNSATQNLISLFCFHIARIPAKTQDNQFVSFFQQQAEHWNQDFIRLGFHFLAKPDKPDKYYLEALISSKHMTTKVFNDSYWSDIVSCYQLLHDLTGSPIVKINLSYCLHKANQTDEALELLASVASQLPSDHFYYTLVKANILEKTNPQAAKALMRKAYEATHQTLRQNYILENLIESEG